jgi:hypothetical protein
VGALDQALDHAQRLRSVRTRHEGAGECDEDRNAGRAASRSGHKNN